MIKGIISFFKRLFGRDTKVVVKAVVKAEPVKEVSKPVVKADSSK